VEVDYLLRTQIRESLEKNFFGNQSQPFAANIAFQVAFCYQIGFGVKANDVQRDIWLVKSQKQLDTLQHEKKAVRDKHWKNEGMVRLLNERHLHEINLAHEYRLRGRKELEEARKEYEREANDITREFGELHYISLYLNQIIADLADELQDFEGAKALRIYLREQTGPNHPNFLQSNFEVLKSHVRLGEWVEAQSLQETLVQLVNSGNGVENFTIATIKYGLASTYMNQGQWNKAEVLMAQIVETGKALGLEFPYSLSIINNLAVIYRNQGRWKEAEKLGMKAVQDNNRVFGQDHPETLTSMSNLAQTYQYQGRYKDAEKLGKHVMELRQRIFGQEHPSTLTSMGNLASTYRNQGRWKEAEELDEQVMKMEMRICGLEHPDTLTSVSNLASTLLYQRRWKEAEALEVKIIETSIRVLGRDHAQTLGSMTNLARAYTGQGRWVEAEKLLVQVITTEKRVWGLEHSETLISMNNLSTIYRDQGRWKEAEELGRRSWRQEYGCSA